MNVGEFVNEQTEKLFKDAIGDSKKVDLNYLNYKKNYIQCSNLMEFYDFYDKDRNWVFCRIQKCHDAKAHANFLRIFKKKDDK